MDREKTDHCRRCDCMPCRCGADDYRSNDKYKKDIKKDFKDRDLSLFGKESW